MVWVDCMKVVVKIVSVLVLIWCFVWVLVEVFVEVNGVEIVIFNKVKLLFDEGVVFIDVCD